MKIASGRNETKQKKREKNEAMNVGINAIVKNSNKEREPKTYRDEILTSVGGCF